VAHADRDQFGAHDLAEEAELLRIFARRYQRSRRQMRALGDTIPRGRPREQLRSQRERSIAEGSNTPAAATLPASRRTLASKGIFDGRDRTSSRNFCSRSQVKPIARKIDAACRVASRRFAVRILLRGMRISPSAAKAGRV
jgi:hypothetical protein